MRGKKDKKNPKKGKPTVNKLESRIEKVEKEVKEIKPEVKVVDVFLQGTFTKTGTIFPLTSFLQGITDSTRIGTKARLNSIQVKGEYQNAPANSVDYTSCRVIIYQDKNYNQNNGAIVTAQVNDVLDVGATVPAFIRFPVWDNKVRFKILYDNLCTFGSDGYNANASTALIPQVKDVEWYKRLNSIISFSGNTAASKNGLYMLLITDNFSGSDAPFYSINTRITYTDA